MSSNKDKKCLEIENLVIVGSGPAGYTAAIYAARANLKPLLLTGFNSGGIPGGQLMTTTFVENFPGFPNGVMGPELMDLMKAQALRWGTELLEADAESINLKTHPFEIYADKQLIRSNSIILATGASANRLGLEKENLFWSKGISACAICDGATPQFREEVLAVVGGGDSACEEAVYLTKYGSHVHLIVRASQLRASASMANRVLANSDITIHWNTEIKEIYGEDWIEKAMLKNKESGKETFIKLRGIFYAIGHTPNTSILKSQIELDKDNYIINKPGSPETSLEGVFAAGDVCDPEWKQGVTAAGAGCKAALAAEKWLSKRNIIQLIRSEEIEPQKVNKPTRKENTTPEEYNRNSLWQKGEYALRKLYHESNRPLLVVYTSQNCGPCHVLKPQLIRVIEELNGLVQGVEIDIEVDMDIAKQAGVDGTPMVQLFKEKILKNQWRGVKQRRVFKEAIKTLIKE